MNENRVKQLRQNGWSLKFELLSDDKNLIDLDLRNFGEKSLPEHSKIEKLGKNLIVQLHKTRNVTAPKENENSSNRTQLLRLIITDGQIFHNALVLPSLKNFSLETPPGVKILIKENTRISNGFLLLNDQCAQLLGGNVEELVHKWKLTKLMGKYVRTMTGEGAPPPWVAFGARLKSSQTVDTSQRSMDVAKVQQPTEEDPEFVRSRRAAIENLVTGEISKSERFSRQNFSRAPNLRKNFEQIQQRTVAEKVSTVEKKGENPVKTIPNVRLPDWAKNQIADGPDDEEKPRDSARFGRNRKNRAEQNEETRPSKDVTLFDFIGAKSKNKKDSTQKEPSAEKFSRQNPQKKTNFPFDEADRILARYAEDNGFYPAIILKIFHDKNKCLVMFEGYETEELLSFQDVQPFEEEFYDESQQYYEQYYPTASEQQYYQQHYDYSGQHRQNSARRYQ